MSKLSPRLRLSLIDRIQSTRTSASPAFTLVELMIVVAIVGLLSAVALPQFLSARDRAGAKAAVGEIVGLAKECATYNAEADITPSTLTGPWGAYNILTCGGSNPVTAIIGSRPFPSSQILECVGSTISDRMAAIIILPSGTLECTNGTPLIGKFNNPPAV